MVTAFLFGQTTDMAKAFPDIEDINLTITQDPYGYYAKHQYQRTSHFTKGNLRPTIPCINPRCKQGGLSLNNLITFNDKLELRILCQGHEGTPAGRHIGDPCDNSFEVRLEIKRRRPKE